MGPITKFTSLGFELNHLLDEKQFVELSEVKEKIKSREIFEWLDEKFNDFDISFYLKDKRLRDDMIDFFNTQLDAIEEERKMGVSKNGLCLLLAYCIEGIQEQRHSIS